MEVERPFLILANPMARRGADAVIHIIKQAAPPVARFQVLYTEPSRLNAGALAGLALGCEALIAVGGDGTVAEAATGLDGLAVALGIVPSGSTNIIARNLGLPLDPLAAAQLIFERKRTRTIDVGLCNGRRFLHMAGSGFDSRIFATTNKRLKRHLGWVAYLQAASQTIFEPPVSFTISVDGIEMACESPLVLVANGGSIIHPAISVHPGIRYDDGYLDVIIFTATNPVEIASTIGRFATRTLGKSPFTIHLRGQVIEISSVPPIPLQLDGDVIGDTPAHFSLLPNALEIIVPD